jgi:hypothetical protein
MNHLWIIFYKTRICFITFLLTFLIICNNQLLFGNTEPENIFSWGLSAGYGYFTYSSDLRALPSVNTVIPLQANGKFNGFYAGGVFSLPITKVLSFQSGLYFYYETPTIAARKNSLVSVNGSQTDGVIEHSIKTNLYNTRLELMAKAGLPLNISVSGGIYFGYNHFNQNYEHTEKAVMPVGANLLNGYDIYHHPDPEISERFNAGFIVGLEYGLINSVDNSLRFNLTYSLGMAQIAKDLDWDAYAVKAGIIVYFNVNKKETIEKPPEQMAIAP